MSPTPRIKLAVAVPRLFTAPGVAPSAMSMMTAPQVKRPRGKPLATRSRGLRERAWWLMRTLPRFTLDDLLFTLAEQGAYKNAPHNLESYCRSLERAGIVKRMQRRIPGKALTSPGHVVWRVATDLGRLAPIVRKSGQGVFDPNSGQLIPFQAAQAALETTEVTCNPQT